VLGEVHASNHVDQLAADVQSLARCHQDPDARRGLQHLADQVDAVQQVLEIVEDEQHLLGLQKVEQLLPGAFPWVETKFELFGEQRHDVFAGRQPRERYETDAVPKPAQNLAPGLDRQAGLADAARPDEADQGLLRAIEQQVGDLEQLFAPPDERHHLRGKIVARRVRPLRAGVCLRRRWERARLASTGGRGDRAGG